MIITALSVKRDGCTSHIDAKFCGTFRAAIVSRGQRFGDASDFTVWFNQIVYLFLRVSVFSNCDVNMGE
jgi:hypothetical protein